MIKLKALYQGLYGPLQGLVQRWNWKTALLSAVVRTFVFFAPPFWGRHHVVPFNVLVEYAYAVIVSGFYGSLAQTYCFAEPRTLVTIVLLTGIPASSQIFEVALRRILALPLECFSMSLSLLMTLISTFLTIAVMRRGYLLVNRA